MKKKQGDLFKDRCRLYALPFRLLFMDHLFPTHDFSHT
tara:strand:+ start:541 stop:654 length:114 start_codon:yes stop_codon:yes gene_type:complete